MKEYILENQCLRNGDSVIDNLLLEYEEQKKLIGELDCVLKIDKITYIERQIDQETGDIYYYHYKSDNLVKVCVYGEINKGGN